MAIEETINEFTNQYSAETSGVQIMDDIEKAEAELGVQDRVYEVDGEQVKYRLLNVERPEQLVEASSIEILYNMQSTGTDQLFQMYGLSYDLINKINEEFEEPVDDYSERTELSQQEIDILRREYEKRKRDWEYSRSIRVLEAATKMEIPGSTMEEKKNFLTSRDTGDVDALNYYAANICTAINEGRHADLMRQILTTVYAQTKKINNFADWETASNSKSFLRICRPFQAYVVQIQMRGIDSKRRLEIDSECLLPAPPERPGIDPQTGRLSMQYKKSNPKDPDYIRSCNAINDKWITMMMDECMPFKIPGDTLEDKKNWIGKRLAGDIFRIRQFIRTDVLGLNTRYNFFTKGSARQN